jgi:tetratricopeptide (TPR) repeat protein
MTSKKLWIALPVLIVASACNRDPKVQAQRYLDNGNKFFNKGKFKEASIMYRRALQKDLRYGEAYYRLALTDLKLASFGEAARMLVRAVELQPENTDAAIKLADLYLLASFQDTAHAEQLTKDAADLADKVVKQNPNSFDAHRIYGQLAMLHKDTAKAVQEFEIASKIRPYNPDLSLVYFEALTASNRAAEAEKLAKEIITREKAYGPIYDRLYLYYSRANRLPEAEEVLKLKVANNPASSDYLLQLAAHYYISKKRPEMEAVLQKLENTKDFPEGRLLAGDFYFFRLREFDAAQREYETGMAAMPKDKIQYEKRLAELFANVGKNDQANQTLASILKEDPKDPDAIAMRAALQLSTGNREQISMAANDLQALVSKAPTNHLYRYNLARALLAKGEVDAARIQLEEAVKLRADFLAARQILGRIALAKGDAGRALKEADGIIALDKNNLQAHLIRSSALLSLNDKEKAHEELNFITSTYPQDAEARYQVGYLAWQDKDYKQAEKIFGELYRDNPKDLRGLVGVVETMASQNRMDDAIAQVKKSIQAEPDRRDLRMALGNLYVRAQKYDDAIALFKELSDKDPRSADLLFRLGETYRRKGDLNTAMDAFRRASQAAPNDTASLLQLGLLMDGTGKREQAKPIYEQILRIQPDHPVALNNLAYIKAEEGVDLDQALTMAQRARQKMPNSTDIADTLGWIYIKKNLSEDAVRVFSELVSKEPKNPTFRYHYGMALMQKGDKIAAKRELEAALQSNPSKDEGGKIRELLQRI